MNRRRSSGFGLSFVLHALVLACTAWLSARPVLRRLPAAVASRMPTAEVEPFDPRSADPLAGTDDDRGSERDDSSLNLPGFRFDFTKVAARATALFPFLRPELLSFERLAPGARREGDGRFNLFALRPESVRLPPLVLGDGALQSLVDAAWSRRERWRPFQPLADFTARFSGDAGRLPDLVRAYVDQNALQPYVDPASRDPRSAIRNPQSAIRDPRLWTELAIAADHADFIAFASRYASEHPSSKATTELLLLLDKLAQGSFDALITLLDVRPLEDLSRTRDASPPALRLLILLQGHYQRELDRRGLSLRSVLQAHYDKVRLTILQGIVDTTPHGYRAGDARYLIGQIHWRAGRVGDARRVWSEITVDQTDAYVRAYSEILEAIRTTPEDAPLNMATIGRILNSERGRWISFSLDRLREFGYRVDQF